MFSKLWRRAARPCGVEIGEYCGVARVHRACFSATPGAAPRVSNIDPEFVDCANIMLWSNAIRSKGAVDSPRGAEDEAEPAGYVAGHNTGLHGWRLSGRSERQDN